MMYQEDIYLHINDGDFFTDQYDNLLHIEDDMNDLADFHDPNDAQLATLLPMTDAGVGPTEVVMKDNENAFLPLYAILNYCGNCLTCVHKLTGMR